VLAILLVNANHVVATDILVEALWPEQAPGRPQTAIQGYVSALRKTLDAGRPFDAIVTEAGGYRIAADASSLDVLHFEALYRTGHECLDRGDLQAAGECLAEALSLFRGAPLADFAYESWALPESARIEELRLACLEDRIEAELALGRHAALVGELEALISQHPLRERIRGQLMSALYRSGRQAEALAAYQAARRTFVEELGIEPSPELRELEAGILRQDPALAVSPAEGRPPTNLPAPPTPLVGRERELDEAAALLLRSDVRLVTITGPGGIGKTRFALELVGRVSRQFADGAFVCELASISDPQLLPSSIAEVRELEAGGQQLDDLVRAIGQRELLLLLDNFEQLVDAAPDVSMLLAACPLLKVVATSRIPLELRAEHRYPLEPLAEQAAVELFVQRADVVAPGFRGDGDVEEICRRVDCLPLAIELAAARVDMYPPDQIVERLEHRLPFLTGGARDAPDRQRTLHATVGWSYGLLSERERRAFARLAAFAGGCTPEAAAKVCDADEGTLRSLLLKSLLRAESGRLLMLETIREYALERLEASGEGEPTRTRHAEWVATIAERADELRTGPEQGRGGGV
jgi:predicted ATPase/DNA-binding SARP family transcriptional activator